MAMYTERKNNYSGSYNAPFATNTHSGGQYRYAQDRGAQGERRLSKEEKKRLTCNHCKESGHEAHEYFKLHGYPERYKRYRDTKGKTKVNYMMDVPDDDTSSKSGERYESRTQYEQQFQQLDIASLIQAEVAKCMNNLGNSSGTTPAPRTDINFVQEGEGQGIFFMDTMHSA